MLRFEDGVGLGGDGDLLKPVCEFRSQNAGLMEPGPKLVRKLRGDVEIIAAVVNVP